jgi:2,4'-dihydroxyacetophenone dioxygenase
VMYYVDSHDKDLGYEGFYTKTDMCRAHFEKVNPGTGDVKKFIL